MPPDEVVLVAPGTVPKTSSGKLRRAATRELFLAGVLGPPRAHDARRRRVSRPPSSARRPARRSRAARRGLYAAWLAAHPPAAALPTWLARPARAEPPLRLRPRALRLGARACGSLGCRLEVEGRERLPRRGPLVLASNHASYVDVAALLALLPFDFLFVAKREVLGLPPHRGLRPSLPPPHGRALGRAAERGRRRTSSRRRCATGRRVLFFPEGTFTAATGLRPFRLGAFKAAADRRGAGRPPRAARHAPRDARRLEPAAPGARPPLGRRADRPRGHRLAALVRAARRGSPTRSPPTAASRGSTSWRRGPSAPREAT